MRGTPREQRPSPGRGRDPRGVNVRYKPSAFLSPKQQVALALSRALWAQKNFQTLSLRGRHGSAGLRSSGEGALFCAARSDVNGGALTTAGDAPLRLGIFVVVMFPRPVGVFPPRRPASRGSRSVCRVVDSCWSHYRQGYRCALPVSIRGTSSVPVLFPGPPGWGAWRTAACPSSPHRHWWTWCLCKNDGG